jgi:hypothetical protein
MEDVNRPMRRMEIAQRIQDLRKKASVQAEAAEAAARDLADDAVHEPVLASSAGAELDATAVVTDDTTTAVADDTKADVTVRPQGGPPAPEVTSPSVAVPASEGPGEPDDDSSASAIASLLRGGQTWILDQG